MSLLNASIPMAAIYDPIPWWVVGIVPGILFVCALILIVWTALVFLDPEAMANYGEFSEEGASPAEELVTEAKAESIQD